MVQLNVKGIQKSAQSSMVSFDFTKTPITQIADYVIIAASKNKTSDIHFDPRDDGLMVRFRIDGDLQDYTFVPKAYEKNLTTRLKLLANMNITESRLPQDGAIKGEYGGTNLDMRVSSLPTNLGEKIVIRILDYSKSLDGMETLGFHPDNLEKVRRLMRLPNGIILTTGATGSGKSTTTYSILGELNQPEKNIITVEDPIEMNIEGINQVQVNAEIGMTFAAALRSILRQDPNIVLIGEIRDTETAQIAVRTSITGHLVLSTIHTNNALATIERLLDMNVERYLLSTALSGIISQRLGKTICQKCRIKRKTTAFERKIMKRHLKKDVKEVYDANPKGCEHCRKGYKGRLAFHEVLEIDDEIRDALNDETLEKEDLRKMVYTEKTITMLQDALIKVLDGKTTFEEVFNAIEIESNEDQNYSSDSVDELGNTIIPSLGYDGDNNTKNSIQSLQQLLTEMQKVAAQQPVVQQPQVAQTIPGQVPTQTVPVMQQPQVAQAIPGQVPRQAVPGQVRQTIPQQYPAGQVMQQQAVRQTIPGQVQPQQQAVRQTVPIQIQPQQQVVRQTVPTTQAPTQTVPATQQPTTIKQVVATPNQQVELQQVQTTTTDPNKMNK